MSTRRTFIASAIALITLPAIARAGERGVCIVLPSPANFVCVRDNEAILVMEGGRRVVIPLNPDRAPDDDEQVVDLRDI